MTTRWRWPIAEAECVSFNLSYADLLRARRDLAHRDFLRREGLAKNPPCIHCGAPIDPDGNGHDDGCSYLEDMTDKEFKELLKEIEKKSAELDVLQAEHRRLTGRNHRWFK